MSRHDELLSVYRREKKIGHVLNLCTDFDFSLVPAINERPVNPMEAREAAETGLELSGNMCRSSGPAW